MDRDRGHTQRKTLMANKGFITWDYTMYMGDAHCARQRGMRGI